MTSTPLYPNGVRLRRGRIAALATAVAGVTLIGAGVLHATTGRGQAAISGSVEPVLGMPVDDLHFVGSSNEGIWGYGRLRGVPAQVAGQRVPADGPSFKKLVFVLRPPGGTYSVAGQPVDRDGHALDGFTPLTQLGDSSMDASGAAAVLGTSDGDSDGDTKTAGVLVRDPGGKFVLAPEPARVPRPSPSPSPEPTPEPEPTPDPGATPDPVATPDPGATPDPAATPDPSAGARAAAATEATTPQATTPGPTTPEATTPDPTTSAAATAAATTAPEPTPAETTPTETTPATTPAPAGRDAVPTTPGVDGAPPLGVDDHLFSADRRNLLAVRESDGQGGVLVGLVSTAPVSGGTPVLENGVAHFDGHHWTRETIELSDTLSPFTFRIVGMSGTGLDDAWLIGRSDDASGKGLELFHRDDDGVWRQRDLGGSAFAQSAPDGTDVTAIAPAPAPAQVLTVSGSGVWIDGTLVSGNGTVPFTAYYDKGQHAITGSWCDASICNHPLGAGLNVATGYRSFAWSGDGGFGQRIITNPATLGATSTSGRGTVLSLTGGDFVRVRGLGTGGPDGVFTSPAEGWLATGDTAGDPVVHFTPQPAAPRLQPWPLSVRRPLTSITTEPGKATGAIDAGALAVGIAGTVVRYAPGRGWDAEFLQDSAGVRKTADLRGVAWPEPTRAYAVGSDGEMWLWRAATGLWESDPAKPLDFDANLTGVAFQPGNPGLGFAVGRQGVILRYGKTWTAEPVPAAVQNMDFTSITFAGSQAIAAWRSSDGVSSGLVTNDGSGWVVDASASSALDGTTDASLYTVDGLPDGGAVAGGDGIVIERSGPSAPWVRSPAPPANLSVVAIAATRDAGGVHAVISAYPNAPGGGHYPAVETLLPSAPGESPQLLPAIQLPAEGVLLREQNGGWDDEEHLKYPGGAAGAPGAAGVADEQTQPDQILALALDPSGTQGWAVGGLVQNEGSPGQQPTDRQKQTAAVFRYPADASAPPPQTASSGISLDGPPKVRFAIGGHAACRNACADAAQVGLPADVGMKAALTAASSVASAPGGPRAFLYTGTRLETGALSDTEAQQFAATAGSPGNLPVYAAPGSDTDGAGLDPYIADFAGFPAPFGQGDQPGNVDTPSSLPGVPPRPGEARNHYAFDSLGSAGAVRVIVIDNSRGSLSAGDAEARPRDASQATWLAAALADAKASGTPAIVVGNRDLSSDSTDTSPASDAATEAQIMLDGGASAYFFDAPGINRTAAIPTRAAATLPEFGTGTLGYASAATTAFGAYYGESGYLLTEIDALHTDPVTNVAPVSVRLIPVLRDLALDATDGTLLRRSRVAQFQALGRRPRMGGVDPYMQFPSSSCQVSACPGRIAPEYSFSSSRPDIADFVQRDTTRNDDHAISLDAAGKPILDATSGLLCAFNAGTTTVTVRSGGLSYSQDVTVQGGAPARPCGTKPLVNPPLRAVAVPVAPPAPAPAPAQPAPPVVNPAIIPLALIPPPPPAAPQVPVVKPVVRPPAFLPPPAQVGLVPLAPPPPPPSVARPIPPPAGGVGVSITQPVSQVERQKEDEEATESSSAFAVAQPSGAGRQIGGGLLMAVILLGAGAGATGVSSHRSRNRGVELATAGRRRRPEPPPRARTRRRGY